MFLNFPIQTNVCSPAWVLKDGFFSFNFSGEYLVWQVSLVWFFKWKVSMTFCTDNHAQSIGGGRARGFLATLRRHKLHMLSYAIQIFLSWSAGTEPESIKACNQVSKMKKTWLGDSDLHENNTMMIVVTLIHGKNSYLYRDCQESMCPPARTTNWCPRDHLRNRLGCPIFFLQVSPSESSTAASSTIDGVVEMMLSVPACRIIEYNNIPTWCYHI